MPRVSPIIDLFLRRAGLSNDQKAALRSDIGAEPAGTAAALIPSRAVRYDAAQTPLNSSQLAQFLDNLGRDGSSDVLDLGTTVLQAAEFAGSRLYDLTGSIVDVSSGLLQDSDGNTVLDWSNLGLHSPDLPALPVASWGYDNGSSAAYFDVGTEYRVNGQSGYTGSFFNANGDELVIQGGIITDMIAFAPL